MMFFAVVYLKVGIMVSVSTAYEQVIGTHIKGYMEQVPLGLKAQVQQ